MRVLVTGVNGFLGRAVAEERSLEAVGQRLREIYRRENILPLLVPKRARA